MSIEKRLDFFEIVSRYTNLKHRGGGKYYGLCPLHPEDTPSFHIDTNLGVFTVLDVIQAEIFISLFPW